MSTHVAGGGLEPWTPLLGFYAVWSAAHVCAVACLGAYTGNVACGKVRTKDRVPGTPAGRLISECPGAWGNAASSVAHAAVTMRA